MSNLQIDNTEEFSYIGDELALFAHARNWKRYFRESLEPFIQGNVLEVGAGLGGTTVVFGDVDCDSWTCLEPDAALLEQLPERVKGTALAEEDKLRTEVNTISSLPAGQLYDSILYIDVLEHIESDREELTNAATHLSDGGMLIVLSPAHQFLFSPFDAAIGHFRRYSAAELKGLAPPGCALVRCRYMDSLGFVASLCNRLLLRQSMPNSKQIRFWDTFLVKGSRVLDPCVLHGFGKSVIAVWKKEGEQLAE